MSTLLAIASGVAYNMSGKYVRQSSSTETPTELYRRQSTREYLVVNRCRVMNTLNPMTATSARYRPALSVGNRAYHDTCHYLAIFARCRLPACRESWELLKCGLRQVPLTKIVVYNTSHYISVLAKCFLRALAALCASSQCMDCATCHKVVCGVPSSVW